MYEREYVRGSEIDPFSDLCTRYSDTSGSYRTEIRNVRVGGLDSKVSVVCRYYIDMYVV